MKKRLICPCGANVTANTYKQHLSLSCNGDIEWKGNALNIASLKTKHARAWKISDGVDAIQSSSWWLDVIFGISKLDDWTFIAPRKIGENTSAAYLKSSMDRKGTNNPAVKSRNKNYDIKELKLFAKILWNKFLEDEMIVFGSIYDDLSNKYPDFSYQFANLIPDATIRGYNKQKTIIAHLVGVTLKRATKEANKRRGAFISVGQRNSEKFIKMASEHGAKMVSSIRVSKPQIRLFNIIKKYDADAVMEYIVEYNNKYRSYDIYSPKLNSLIEMHGRVWHELGSKNVKMNSLVSKNIKNDELKKIIAKEKQLDLIVFWDDEDSTWEERVKSLYEKT